MENVIDLFSEIFQLVPSVLLILGTYKVFEKAGVPGWKAIVPFYREYIIFDISKSKKAYFWTYLGTIIGALVCLFLAVFMFAFAFTSDSGSALLIVCLFILIAGACSITANVMLILAYYRLFCSFGKEKGLAILFSIFAFIGFLIVGFDNSVYEKTEEQTVDQVKPDIPSFCSNCGSKVQGKFCANCGNKIE